DGEASRAEGHRSPREFQAGAGGGRGAAHAGGIRAARELHKAQDKPGFSGALVGGLVTEGWERTYPEQENVPTKIFGGYLVRRAYELASINAEEIAPDRPLIVAVNRINFLQPVRMGDKLHFVSRVVYTGDTSVCV